MPPVLLVAFGDDPEATNAELGNRWPFKRTQNTSVTTFIAKVVRDYPRVLVCRGHIAFAVVCRPGFSFVLEANMEAILYTADNKVGESPVWMVLQGVLPCWPAQRCGDGCQNAWQVRWVDWLTIS